jgi:hypothetical protein
MIKVKLKINKIVMELATMKTNNTRKLVYNNKNKMKDNKLIPSIYF